MKKDDWKIKIADDLCQDDNENMCKFLQLFRSVEDEPFWSPEYYRWDLKDNPAGEGFLTLAVSDEKVVGTTSVTPKHIWYKGDIINAAEFRDGYTHPDFQRRGIFTAVAGATIRRAQEAGHSLVYGLPNEQTRPSSEKKLEFLTHPNFRLTRHKYICKPPAFMEQNFPHILNQLLSQFMKLILYFLRKSWVFVGKLFGISVKQVNSIGPEYNKLWEKYRWHNDFLLVRDFEYLHYRFFKHPLAKYEFYEARRKGQIYGYLVTRRQKVSGKFYCIIADWFYNFKDPLIFLSLLNTALEKNLSHNIDGCHTWVTQSSPDKWLFAMSGFVPRGWAPIIFHKNSIGKQILNRKDKWHFTIADSDNI